MQLNYELAKKYIYPIEEIVLKGSSKLIENHLRAYHKRRHLKLAKLERIGLVRFIRNEVDDRGSKSKVRDVIVNAISKDVILKSFFLNRKYYVQSSSD